MAHIITITDDLDSDTTAVALGAINSIQTFKIRVWNNRGGTLPGITDVTNVSLALQFSPEKQNNLIVRNNCIKGRCTYSAKLDAVVSESFYDFPIEDSDYDTIPSNKYNEYEIQVDMTGLTNTQKQRIEDILATVFFTVNHG